VDLGAHGLRLGDDPGDLGQPGVVAHTLGQDGQVAFLDHRARVDLVPHGLAHGQGLPGHGGLVDHGRAVGHHAVHGDGQAGPDDDQIARLQLGGGHALGLAPAQHPGRAVLAAQHGRDVPARFFAGPFLQGFADVQQQVDGSGGN
jgi:hypothetical protein